MFTANGVEFQSTARGGNVFINSPYIITKFLILLSLLMVFITPAFIANSVLKDVDNQFDGILFSTPISKKDYIFGRFLGSFFALILVFSAAPIGLFLGTFWPWAVPETLAANNYLHYLIVYFGVVLPSLFTVSAIIYAVALISGSMLYSYFAALGMLILFITVDISTAISSLWDPFMAEAFAEQTKYWTASERNSNLLSYTDVILSNRLLWFGLALGVFSLAYSLFSFQKPVKIAKVNPDKHSLEATLKAAVDADYQGSASWSKNTHFQQLLFRTSFEMMSVVKSKPFMLLMGFSFFLLFFSLTGRETLYQVDTYPLTRILLGAIQGSLTAALMAVLSFYSADIIWRERSCQFNDIIDALPTPNWVFVVSKIAALALIMHVIVLLGIIIAISLQLLSGFHDIQISNYISRGLIYYTVAYVYLAVLCCLFHVLANNRQVGILFFVVFMLLLVLSRDIFGFEHLLISYGLPGIAAPLSDMNSDGRFATAGYWLRLYWGSIAGMLLMLTYVLWNRGTLQPLKYRLRRLRVFKSKEYALPILVLLAVFLSSGSYIFYNTNVLNKYRTTSDIEQLSLAYEQKYQQFANLPMPRIVDVKIEVDIYPYRRRVEARATQILQNKTSQTINTVHVIFPIELKVIYVELHGAVQKSVDTDLAYYIFDLKTPLLPDQKIALKFETLIQQHGFPNSRPDIKLVRNGTFIGNNHLTPQIGYSTKLLISDRNTRRDYGLPPLPRLPKLEDTASHNNSYISQDSDFIAFETTVSTVANQIAVSSGYLVKEWTQGNRRYFHYKMDVPIMNFYSYLSADYKVVHDHWNDIDIEVFHHAAHTYNIDRMLASVKDSLAYFSQTFGPYQYKQLRILEFPAYRNFARAYPNTIPFSEGIGFVADVRDPFEIDLPYYVTAHEVAHQWWAHQVMAANSQGGTMLAETFAQYSALLVMEQKYGKHQLRKFLKYELDHYLSKRADDAEGELPLYRVENQAYIHYRKGALIMYALKDYIGEDILNRSLKLFISKWAYATAPYAISTDFLDILKQQAGANHLGLIEDFFEKITLFDLKMVQATVTELVDGRYKVTLDVEVAKFYANANGNETETPFNLPVDIGLFLKSPADNDFHHSDVIMLNKQHLTDNGSSIDFIVNEKPLYAGIDPYNKLIDRNSNDNLAKIENTGSYNK
ncbi:MAG: hypothetical protein JKY19_02125 [Alcanivoracaceae bacterium]|nr:hypothetical protein [Alcanivoracaceae bacterium]